MKALILSAGQGRRLLPLTAQTPKCLVPVHGLSLIEWQIDELFGLGIDPITVVVGYGADQVEGLLMRRYGGDRIHLIYNMKFAETDNLYSCWEAREVMSEDFILLNGDTLFEKKVIERLLSMPENLVTVVTDHKSGYDDDDMKVTLTGERLINIGKDIPPDETDAESAGIILFRGQGPLLFREAIEKALADPTARNKWYLSVIKEMSRSIPVWTCSIRGLKWCEIDYPADLRNAERVVNTVSCYKNLEKVTDYIDPQTTGSCSAGSLKNYYRK